MISKYGMYVPIIDGPYSQLLLLRIRCILSQDQLFFLEFSMPLQGNRSCFRHLTVSEVSGGFVPLPCLTKN